MNVFRSGWLAIKNKNTCRSLGWRRWVLAILAVLCSGLLLGTPTALAGMNDDNYDGNIYLLYGGNGGLVPPKNTLAQSLKDKKPTLLVYYVDDSSDCKQFAPVISRLQVFYDIAVSFIPVRVDAIPTKSSYKRDEPGYYYKGLVPQTVLLNQNGKVVFNESGKVAFEKVDDALRKVFNLEAREQSGELQQRSFNEFNSELAE